MADEKSRDTKTNSSIESGQGEMPASNFNDL